MFKFGETTQSDSTGVSRSWLDRARVGVAMAVLAGVGLSTPAVAHGHHLAPATAVAAPSDRTEDRYREANEKADALASRIVETGANSFLADTLNAPQNPAIRRATENTVIVVFFQAPVSGKDPRIEFGSGAVIANSDQGDGNGILTAGHVIGAAFGEAAGSDPCDRRGARCVAYSQDGRPLGRLFRRGHHSGMGAPAKDVETSIGADIVVMDIQPYDDRFAQMPGIPLAQEIPAGVIKAQVSKTYHSADGTDFVEGVSPGASGGPILNDNGEVVGVVSAVRNVWQDPAHPGDLLTTAFPGQDPERSTLRGNTHVLREILAHPDQEKTTGIPNEAFSVLSHDVVDNIKEYPKNWLFMPTVGDSAILDALGDAGRDVSVTAERKSIGITPVGNPGGVSTVFDRALTDPSLIFDRNFNETIRIVNDDGSPLDPKHPDGSIKTKAVGRAMPSF